MFNNRELISQVAVTAAQMRDIEGRIFAAGIPVAALMEKVAGLITRRVEEIFQQGDRETRRKYSNFFPHSLTPSLPHSLPLYQSSTKTDPTITFRPN